MALATPRAAGGGPGPGKRGPGPGKGALPDPLDLADPELYVSGDAFAVWDHLRVHAPVYLNRRADGSSFWALTTHDLATSVYENRETFTSERGMRVGGEDPAGRVANGRGLIVTDGIRHRQMRDILGPAFTPRAVRRMEPIMQEVVAETLAEVADLESFDLVSRLAARLPLFATCALLGVPRSDWPLMIEMTRTAFGSVVLPQDAREHERDRVISPEERQRGHAEIFLYSTELAEHRRRHPGEDLVSAMVHGESKGYRMSMEDIQVNINGILTGGNETTRHATAGGVQAFIEHPDQWRRLKADPSLLPRTIEEILRWTAPSLHVMRTAIRDTRLGDRRIRAGEQVTIWNPAVNRDGAAFPRADRFDIGRWPNRHVTFGLGQHFCIGAALARLELHVVFTALATQVSRFVLTGAARRLHSNIMWGLDYLPVRIEREGRHG